MMTSFIRPRIHLLFDHFWEWEKPSSKTGSFVTRTSCERLICFRLSTSEIPGISLSSFLEPSFPGAASFAFFFMSSLHIGLRRGKEIIGFLFFFSLHFWMLLKFFTGWYHLLIFLTSPFFHISWQNFRNKRAVTYFSKKPFLSAMDLSDACSPSADLVCSHPAVPRASDVKPSGPVTWLQTWCLKGCLGDPFSFSVCAAEASTGGALQESYP